MSQAKFDAALELIREKRYAEARAILRTINEPKAYAWLKRLDEINPPQPQRKYNQTGNNFHSQDRAPTTPKKKEIRNLKVNLLIIGAVLIFAGATNNGITYDAGLNSLCIGVGGLMILVILVL